jgi:hypothetical protein
MNSKKSKSHFVIFFLLNIALFCAYGYLFFVVDSKNKATTLLYSASHQAASDKEKIRGLERTLKDTEEDRNKLSEYFVTKTSAVAFIERIENLGKSAGVELSVNSVSDAAKNSGVLQLDFSATGSFSNMYRLMALVESMPYKVTLKKASMQKIGDQQEVTGDWKGDFMVTLESFVATSAAIAPAEASSGVAKK